MDEEIPLLDIGRHSCDVGGCGSLAICDPGPCDVEFVRLDEEQRVEESGLASSRCSHDGQHLPRPGDATDIVQDLLGREHSPRSQATTRPRPDLRSSLDILALSLTVCIDNNQQKHEENHIHF